MPKAKGIYIFGSEPQSGKSVVLLGIMELLSRHVQKLGFFRPLVREGDTRDDAIRLITGRYRLPFPNSARYGMTYEGARVLVGDSRWTTGRTRRPAKRSWKSSATARSSRSWPSGRKKNGRSPSKP